MTETAAARLKRLSMRSWRRGMKEMDLILGPYADETLARLSPEALDLFDALLSQNDQDIYPWISGAASPPPRFRALIGEIADFARRRHARPA